METNQLQKIEVRQDYNVSAEVLFHAWTEEAQLKEWWKPINNELQEVINELNEGGNVEYRFAGNHLHISGQYKTVKPNELLEYSWNWEFPEDPIKNAEFSLSVKFASSGEGSSITVTQESAENHEALHPHQAGWEEGLKALGEFVEKK